MNALSLVTVCLLLFCLHFLPVFVITDLWLCFFFDTHSSGVWGEQAYSHSPVVQYNAAP